MKTYKIFAVAAMLLMTVSLSAQNEQRRNPSERMSPEQREAFRQEMFEKILEKRCENQIEVLGIKKAQAEEFKTLYVEIAREYEELSKQMELCVKMVREAKDDEAREAGSQQYMKYKALLLAYPMEVAAPRYEKILPEGKGLVGALFINENKLRSMMGQRMMGGHEGQGGPGRGQGGERPMGGRGQGGFGGPGGPGGFGGQSEF